MAPEAEETGAQLLENSERGKILVAIQGAYHNAEYSFTQKKKCPSHYRGLECKSRKSGNTWSNRYLALEYRMKQGKG